MFEKETLVCVASGPVAAELGDELALLDISSGRYYAFNDIGSRLWSWMQTPISVGSLLARIMAEYEIDESTCAQDLDLWLQQLQARGLIVTQRPEQMKND